MGSTSDWETMKHADELLTRFGVAHECRVMSAHRSPKLTAEWAASAEKRGLAVIIAAAGGAAHLAGVLASHTVLPVLGVPMESASLKGLDSLLSTVQMPAGVPVGTLGIGKPGAVNAALLAVAILAVEDPKLRAKLRKFRADQEKAVRSQSAAVTAHPSIRLGEAEGAGLPHRRSISGSRPRESKRRARRSKSRG